MSIQTVLFIVAVIAFAAALILAGLAVYDYRSKNIAEVRADLSGEVKQGSGPRKTTGGRKRRFGSPRKATGGNSGAEKQPDDAATKLGVRRGADDSATRVAANGPTGMNSDVFGDDESNWATQDEVDRLAFGVVEEEIETHSDKVLGN